MHHLFKLLTGGNLYRAPITLLSNTHNTTNTTNNNDNNSDPPKRILDLGTGTGIWALDMAEEFPNAEIVGVDLSPIQPNWAPPNCRFFVDDIESDWTFTPEEAFDYIHARSLAGGIGDWDRLLRQAYNHVKPGGWVEVQEAEAWIRSDDGTHEHAQITMEFQRKLRDASSRFGKGLDVAGGIGGRMRELGFVDVVDDVYKVSLPFLPLFFFSFLLG